MWNVKDIYYVSDSTALLTEDMGKSLLCQFPEIGFNEEKIPFVRSINDARKALDRIKEQSGGLYPVIFCTIMDKDVRNVFDSAEVEMIDLYGGFLDQLERILEARAVREPGFFRKSDDSQANERVEAIHYSIEHDDGQKTREYGEAEVILVGVSRTGKTPVSVYLATHMGLKAANFALTSDHLDAFTLPDDIVHNRNRAVGLTISAQFLHKIRQKRYPDSNYAKLSTCSTELKQAEQLFMQHGIQTLKTGGKSIEELSVQVTQLLGISKKKWRRHQ